RAWGRRGSIRNRCDSCARSKILASPRRRLRDRRRASRPWSRRRPRWASSLQSRSCAASSAHANSPRALRAAGGSRRTSLRTGYSFAADAAVAAGAAAPTIPRPTVPRIARPRAATAQWSRTPPPQLFRLRGQRRAGGDGKCLVNALAPGNLLHPGCAGALAPAGAPTAHGSIVHQKRQLVCFAAMLSPETGIIDSHSYMRALRGDLEDRSGMVALNTRIERIVRVQDGWRIHFGSVDPQSITVDAVINAAG